MNIPEFKDANRKRFEDKILDSDITSEKYCKNTFNNSIYTRVFKLGKQLSIKNISFEHSYFIDCKLRKVHFENCSFVNCYFYSCDFSRSTFSNCDFRYSKFKDTLVDPDIFNTAPRENNLLMKFANNLRINYRDLGDKYKEDIAIQYELNANEEYLYDCWSSENIYYRKKYQGFERFKKLIEWLGFKVNKFIWGNGEDFFRLVASFLTILSFIGFIVSLYSTNEFSTKKLFSTIFGVISYFIGSIDNSEAISIIQSEKISLLLVTLRTVFFGLFVSILIKKYSRR